MKPERDADEQFEWDMTAGILLVLFIMFVLAVGIGFGPWSHVR